MPKRNKRKGHKQPKHSHKSQTPNQHSSPRTGKYQQNLININNQTIIIYNAGDKNCNGVYSHRDLDGDYFERIGSIQTFKHSNLNQQSAGKDPTETENKEDDNDDDTKDDQNQNNKSGKKIKKSNKKGLKEGKYEIDRHEYLKNPDDIPDPSLNKSGCWVLSRVDVYPKKLLYAVNCPFKDKLKTNGWIVLKDGVNPPPKIKLFETRQVTDNEDNHTTSSSKKRRKKKEKPKDNIQDTIKSIRDDHHDKSGQKLNDQQLKAMQSKSKESRKKMKKGDNQLMIVCGGQTGVDRAALDVAISLNIPYSGWVPQGRKAEDGIIDIEKYKNLKECNSEDYDTRTLLNVVDSDATLILNMGQLDGGTLTTKKYVSQKNKDLMYITLFQSLKVKKDGSNDEENQDQDQDEEKKLNDDNDDRNNDEESDDDYCNAYAFTDGRAQRVGEWIRCNKYKVLNIAGPRESSRAGVYDEAVKFLTNVLQYFKDGKFPHKSLYG